MAFHYNAVSKTNGKVTTRVSLQGNVTTAQIVAGAIARLATRGITVTAELATAVGTAVMQEVITQGMRESKSVLRLFGLYSFRPACGGEFDSFDFQPTPEAMNLAARGNVAPDGQTLFETNLEFVRDNNVGQKAALIERVYNATTNSTDRYTAGGGFKISGDDFGQPDLVSSEFGVFLEPVAGGPRTRCASIIDWTSHEITGAWAAGVTGPQKLVIVTQYDFGTPRTTTYGTNLTP